MSSVAEASKPLENATTLDTLVRFHMALNVPDVDRSVAFYRALFGVEPARWSDGLAKFVLNEPPLVLSLVPHGHAGGGPLNHVGIRLNDSKVMIAAQVRLESAGFKTQREEGVECCHARQTKFWVTDPDNTLWELYLVHENLDEVDDDHPTAPSVDVHHLGSNGSDGASSETASTENSSQPAKVMWQHFLVQPVPQRIDHENASVDEVHLQGTFNLSLDDAKRSAFLAEVRRVLRPGGRVWVHGLAGDRPLTTTPKLPGPAALVEHVFLLGSVAQTMAEAGFANVQYLKVGKSPCFVIDGVEMRELQLSANKPA